MSNWGLRILSMLIAILLSIYVNSENNITSARVFVGVEVRDLPEDKIIIWQLKKQVEIEVRGPSFLVSRISSSPPTLRVKLPDEVGAKYTAQINKTDFNIESPLQIISIDPSSISFAVEKKMKKELPVKVARIGQLREDLRLGDITVSPETVVVVGPESEVKDLQSVMTSAIDLKDIKATTTEEIGLKVPGKQTELSKNSVKMTIQVSALDVHRTFEALPIELRMSTHDGITVSPESVSVTLVGSKDVIDSLKPATVIPYVRVAQIPATAEEVPVQVEVPPGITVVAKVPEKVKVVHQNIKKKGM